MLRNLLLTTILLLLSGVVLYLTLYRLDPLSSNKILAYFSFYVSVFLSVSMFFTLFFFFFGELKKKRKLGNRQYLVSLRRGCLVGVFTIGVLVLQWFKLSSIFKCSTSFTPELGCAEVVLGIGGLLEVVLWGAFLVIVELIFSSGKRV